MRTRSRWLVFASPLALVVVVALACGGGDEPTSEPSPPPPIPEEPPATEETAPSIDANAPLSLDDATLTDAELGEACAPNAEARGSLHAETMYQVPLEEPSNGKVRQSVSCEGRAMVVFFYDFGTPSAAHSASGWMAAQLYGAVGRATPRNPDALLRRHSVVAVVSGRDPAPLVQRLADARGFRPAQSLPAPDATPPSGDVTAEQLAAFRARLDCEGAHEVYCAALDAFGEGRPTPLPSAPHSWLGRSVLGDGTVENVTWALLRPDGLNDGAVTPDNDQEAAQLETTLEALRAGEAVPADDPVGGFVASLTNNDAMPSRPTEVLGDSRTYTSEDRRVYYRSTGEDGTGLVILDVSEEGLERVSVYH